MTLGRPHSSFVPAAGMARRSAQRFLSRSNAWPIAASAARPIRAVAARRTVALVVWLALVSCGGSPQVPPHPSPNDGLVFVLPREAHGADVALVRLSDGAVQLVVDSPDKLEEDPHWVSSVQRVLYTERPAQAPMSAARLMMRDPQTGESASASVRHDYRESKAAVSADGRRVVFLFESPPGLMPPLGVKLLVPMSSHDDTLSPPPAGGLFVAPQISADGSQVVAQVHWPARGDDVFLLLTDGGLRPLSSNPRWNDVGPRFARGDGSIFFSRSLFETPVQARRRRNAGGPEPLGGGDVCKVHIETQRIDCILASADAREYQVAPSPARDEIVFVREQDGTSDLYLADADGKDVRALTHEPQRAERDPRWSPDGERVAFTAGPPDSPVIVVVDRDGEVLLETPGHSPDWAPPLFAPEP